MQAEHRKQSSGALFGSLLGAAALAIATGSAWTTARAETTSAPQPERPIGKPAGTPGIAVPQPPAQAAQGESYRRSAKDAARASTAASAREPTPAARGEAAASAASASAASAAASKPHGAMKKKGAAKKAPD